MRPVSLAHIDLLCDLRKEEKRKVACPLHASTRVFAVCLGRSSLRSLNLPCLLGIGLRWVTSLTRTYTYPGGRLVRIRIFEGLDSETQNGTAVRGPDVSNLLTFHGEVGTQLPRFPSSTVDSRERRA